MKRIMILFLLTGQILFAQEWTDLHLLGSGMRQVWATSELDDGLDHSDDYFSFNRKYGVFNLFDGDSSTAWVEGVEGSGTGESIYLVIPENSRSIQIFNGYGKNRSLFEKNNRVKSFMLSCFTAINPEAFVSEAGVAYLAKKFPDEVWVSLKDTFGLQSFEFPFSWDELNEFREQVINAYHQDYDIPVMGVYTILRLEISEVYKGSTWDDTCISELVIRSSYLPGREKIPFPEVLDIYIDSDNDGRILMDIPGKEGTILLEDESAVFQVIETSPDHQWVTVIRMPSEIKDSRVETEWLIMNTMLGKVMNAFIEKVEKRKLSGPFFLTGKDGEIYLEDAGGEVVLR